MRIEMKRTIRSEEEVTDAKIDIFHTDDGFDDDRWSISYQHGTENEMRTRISSDEMKLNFS